MNAGDVIQTRYELTEPLGQGGMAEVWLAHDPNLGRSVAIKFLAPQLSADPEFLVRFFAEAQAVARINHPNVVKVLDFGEHEDSPYLVMESVPGGPLTQRTGEPHEPDWAMEIVAAAARAAGAAHELGIVHRDIKPGNILLDEDGAAKLCDFGIASSGRVVRLTATGAAIGSPHYISPEQASGGEAAPASDVYALGIVLYELLTGVRPFEADNVTAIAIAHVDQEPLPPSTHIPELGPGIDALVMRCLAKDPALRFTDGTELAVALESFNSEEIAPPLGLVETERWWAGRKAILAGAALATLLALPAFVLLSPGDEDSVAATVEERQDRLPNVGGLKLKSPSPTPSFDDDGVAVAPTPEPTEREEIVTASERRERERTNEEPAEEPEPEPTPEPTQAEPTPEPTGSPAP